MAENDEANKSQTDSDSLDDDFEFDLFEESDSEPARDAAKTEDIEVEDFDTDFETDFDESLDTESGRSFDARPSADDLHDDLHDDLTDDLGDDIFELSDAEVQEEFAALEREESLTNSAAESAGDSNAEQDNSASSELDASLSGAVDSVADELQKNNIEYDPDTSDDLDFELTREEFGAPDREVKPVRSQTGIEDNADKEGVLSAANGLPAVLASLANLPPKVIVAATAAVLVPLVVFTVLGLNSGDSDAVAQVPAATFNDEAGSDAVTEQLQSLPERPAPELSPRTVMPATDSEADTAITQDASQPVLAEDPVEQSLVSADTEEAAATESELADSGLLLAQAQTDTQLAAESTDDASDLATANPDDNLEPGVVESSPESVASPTENIDATTASNAPTVQDAASDDVAVEDTPPEAEPQIAESDSASDNQVASEQIDREPAAPAATTEAVTSADNTPAATAASSGRNYHIIVASFPNNTDAQAHAERISDAEISAYVIAPFGSSNNYRVAVASYASLAEAQQNIPGLRNVYGEGIWPLRYPPAGDIPLLSARSGETFIIVASFPTVELARTHAESLRAAGEQPAIIAPYAPSNRYRVAVARFPNSDAAQNALANYRRDYGSDSWLLRY